MSIAPEPGAEQRESDGAKPGVWRSLVASSGAVHDVTGRFYGWVVFFDRRCPLCGTASRRVCLACVNQLDREPEVTVAGLDQVVALFSYDHRSARLVLAGKNGGRRDLLRWSALHLSDAVGRHAALPTIDLVTWVPAHPTQQRTRGFDQGEILARTVARTLHLPCRATLRRRPGPSQKGLARSERLNGPRFEAKRRVAAHVLLVDDVVTTGASLERSASVLRIAGAEHVVGAVIAASVAKRQAVEPERAVQYSKSGSAPEERRLCRQWDR
jgi:predicted amidophosphoribosyltransferase